MSNPAVTNLTPSDPPTSVTAYYSALLNAVRQSYGQQVEAGTIYSVDDMPPFYYVMQNPSTNNIQRTNALTYAVVDSLAAPSVVNPGSVSLTPSSFWLTYQSLVNQITYTLSAADQATLTQDQLNASASMQSLLTNYQSTFGQITPAQLAAASTAIGYPLVPIDYVMLYVMGMKWSGNPSGLSYQQMQNAQNLESLLPKMPASGANFLGSVTAYLNALGESVAIMDELNAGNFTIAQIRNNLLAANLSTQSNGVTVPGPAATLTFDPTNGADATYYPAYTLTPPDLQTMLNGLGNTKDSFSITMEVNKQSDSTYNVSIDGSGGFDIDAGFFSWGTNASASYNLSSSAGTGSSCTITLTYTGFQKVDVTPMMWSAGQWSVNANNTPGWFNPAMIQQAYVNYQTGQSGGTVPTGFNFQQAPVSGIGHFPDGQFHYVSSFLLTNPPSISISFAQGDFDTFSQTFEHESSTEVDLFGIVLARATSSSYQATATQNSSDSGFTLSFGPPSGANVAQTLNSAYIVGAVIASPGAP